MVINLEILIDYKEKGLLRCQFHPEHPLTIWNYTEKVQFEGLWDDVTKACRGLIFDHDINQVIVYPFEKFFNYEEVKHRGIIPTNSEYIYIQDKMDGSLGILFDYHGEWIMATRGSFISDQAIKGLEIVKKQCSLEGGEKYVYFVEIIYPENRIVVDYNNEEKVIFLSMGPNYLYDWGESKGPHELNWTTTRLILKNNLNIEEKYIVDTKPIFDNSFKLFDDLKSKNIGNKEGYVLRFYPSNFRMKIKFEDYIRLHKLMTDVSTTSVWEILSKGQNVSEHLEGVPDEYFDKIKQYETYLKKYHSIMITTIYSTYYRVMDELGDDVDQKTFALHIKDEPFKSFLFSLRANKEINNNVWKSIKPEFKKL